MRKKWYNADSILILTGEKVFHYGRSLFVSDKRYEKMVYNRVGKSGLKFPAVSLGFWHNFGSKDNYDNMKAMCRKAFDLGITQFDLANNYGPVYGSAEKIQASSERRFPPLP